LSYISEKISAALILIKCKTRTISTILVDLASQHTFAVNMLGMKGINFI